MSDRHDQEDDFDWTEDGLVNRLFNTNTGGVKVPTQFDIRKKALNAQMEQLSRQMDRVIDEITDLEALEAALPDLEQYPAGSIITWEKRFTQFGSDRVYTYAAIKCPNDLWYTTGPKRPGPWTTTQLAQFVLEGNVDGRYWEVDSMTQVDL